MEYVKGDVYGMTREKFFEIQEQVWPGLYCPRNPDLIYEPWDCRDGRPGPFKLFHKRKERNFVGILPNRLGKDYAIAGEICPLLLCPNKRILLTGATNALSSRCFDWILEMLVPLLNKNKIPYRLLNSQQLQKLILNPHTSDESFVEVHSFKTLSALEGVEMDLVVVGEAGDISTDMTWMIEKMPARLLSRLGSFIVMTTPDMRNPGLIDYVDLQKEDPDTLIVTSSANQFTSYDCPYINTAELDRLKRILPEKTFREKVLGEFTMLIGKCLPSFSIDHVGQYERSLYVKSILSIDWGYAADPTVFVIGFYYNGIFYITHEYFFHQKTATQLLPMLNSLMKEHNIEYIVSDRDYFASAELEVAGYPVNYAHKPRLSQDIPRLDAMFANNLIRINQSCTGLLNEINKLVWSKHSKPYGSDHYIDALRYLTSFVDMNIALMTEYDIKHSSVLNTHIPFEKQIFVSNMEDDVMGNFFD